MYRAVVRRSVELSYHGEQEELFYVVEGIGQLLIGEDEELVEIPEGGFIRPGVRTPRSLRNDTDEEVVWLVVSALSVFEGVLWNEYDEEGRPAETGEFVDVKELL